MYAPPQRDTLQEYISRAVSEEMELKQIQLMMKRERWSSSIGYLQIDMIASSLRQVVNDPKRPVPLIPLLNVDPVFSKEWNPNGFGLPDESDDEDTDWYVVYGLELKAIYV
jgi:hypothetical protein